MHPETRTRFGHWLWPVGFDVKLLTNCRFGMMFWGVGVPIPPRPPPHPHETVSSHPVWRDSDIRVTFPPESYSYTSMLGDI